MQEQYDILIVGAGLSGIGMACHLADTCPQLSLGLVERRRAVGGTWDLFRYPGVRSDSDMFSFGYGFRPWNAFQVLADGPSIRRYVEETARNYGVDGKIRFGLKIVRAAWSSDQRRWTLTAIDETDGAERKIICRFLIACTGYYNYDRGYLPEFPGVERFGGRCIHPQQWPEDLDYRGKRVVVIGSGATAVTLVPAMAAEAGHITMLQRSPSYILPLPAYDRLSAVLGKLLPARWVFGMARRRNILLQQVIYKSSRRWPGLVRRLLLANARRQLGAGFDMRHFSPSYGPWDERMCAVPGNNLFKAIRSGKAEVVTDTVDTFTEHGIRLQSGRELEADIVVTATGLQVQVFGGAEIVVDGRPRAVNELMTYKGVLLQDVPNMGWIIGYINASWTLKVDIAAAYLCRLLQHMERTGSDVAVARAPAGTIENGSILEALKSGYVRRARPALPRQGRTLPWRVLHDYGRDRRVLLDDPVEDDALEFLPCADPVRRGNLAAAA